LTYNFRNFTHVIAVEEVDALTVGKQYEIDYIEGYDEHQYVHIKQNDHGDEDWFVHQRFVPVEKETPVFKTNIVQVGDYIEPLVEGFTGLTVGKSYRVTNVDKSYRVTSVGSEDPSQFFITNDLGYEDYWYYFEGDFKIVEGPTPTVDDTTVSTVRVVLKQPADEQAGYHVEENSIDIDVEDGNGEAYLVISTSRWSLNADEIDRFAARLKAVLALKGSI